MTSFSHFSLVAAISIALSLCTLQSVSAQDSKPPAAKKEPAAKKKDPATRNSKGESAGDTNATGEELGKLLEVHGVTCEQCEGDACGGCKMKPIPEGAAAFPLDDHNHEHSHGDRLHMHDHDHAHGEDHNHSHDHNHEHSHGDRLHMHDHDHAHGEDHNHSHGAGKPHRHHKMMKRLQNTRRSVVRVVNARKRGTGFLFGSRQHVITALDVVDSGRSTYVIDYNGAEINARIVGTDRGAGLALLELDAELSDAEPLRAAKNKGPHFGHAMVIGNHYGAGQRWGVDLNKLTNGVVQGATISSRDGDALLLGNSFPDTFAGAPVVAPNGQLLGVIRWVKKKHHSSIATSAHRVQGFYNAHGEGKNEEYLGRIRMRLGGGVIGFAGNESTFGAGLQLSSSVDFFDMFGVTMRAAYALGTQDLSDDDFTTDILSRNYGRWILDGVAYYRFLMPGFFGKKTPVSIGVGGAYVHDSGDERVLQDGTFVTNEFTYDRGMFEADLQIGWLRGSFFIRLDETDDWFFTLSASMQY